MQNRWLTILCGAIIIVVIVAITAGPGIVRMIDDAASDSPSQVGEQTPTPVKY